jgi:hypothetical protein
VKTPRRRALTLLLVALLEPVAAGASAQAAHSFPEVPVTETAHGSHRWAYATLLSGVTLIGVSFPLSAHADDLYDQYLVATDPGEIERLYDDTNRFDWYARGALISGELMVATGLYLRFLRNPKPASKPSTLGLVVTPTRCALAWRF